MAQRKNSKTHSKKGQYVFLAGFSEPFARLNIVYSSFHFVFRGFKVVFPLGKVVRLAKQNRRRFRSRFDTFFNTANIPTPYDAKRAAFGGGTPVVPSVSFGLKRVLLAVCGLCQSAVKLYYNKRRLYAVI